MWSMRGITHSCAAGGKQLWEKSGDETGRGIKGEIVMDFVLAEEFEFYCIISGKQQQTFYVRDLRDPVGLQKTLAGVWTVGLRKKRQDVEDIYTRLDN